MAGTTYTVLLYAVLSSLAQGDQNCQGDDCPATVNSLLQSGKKAIQIHTSSAAVQDTYTCRSDRDFINPSSTVSYNQVRQCGSVGCSSGYTTDQKMALLQECKDRCTAQSNCVAIAVQYVEMCLLYTGSPTDSDVRGWTHGAQDNNAVCFKENNPTGPGGISLNCCKSYRTNSAYLVHQSTAQDWIEGCERAAQYASGDNSKTIAGCRNNDVLRTDLNADGSDPGGCATRFRGVPSHHTDNSCRDANYACEWGYRCYMGQSQRRRQGGCDLGGGDSSCPAPPTPAPTPAPTPPPPPASNSCGCCGGCWCYTESNPDYCCCDTCCEGRTSTFPSGLDTRRRQSRSAGEPKQSEHRRRAPYEGFTGASAAALAQADQEHTATVQATRCDDIENPSPCNCWGKTDGRTSGAHASEPCVYATHNGKGAKCYPKNYVETIDAGEFPRGWEACNSPFGPACLNNHAGNTIQLPSDTTVFGAGFDFAGHVKNANSATNQWFANVELSKCKEACAKIPNCNSLVVYGDPTSNYKGSAVMNQCFFKENDSPCHDQSKWTSWLRTFQKHQKQAPTLGPACLNNHGGNTIQLPSNTTVFGAGFDFAGHVKNANSATNQWFANVALSKCKAACLKIPNCNSLIVYGDPKLKYTGSAVMNQCFFKEDKSPCHDQDPWTSWLRTFQRTR